MEIRPAIITDYEQLCELFDEVDILHREALPAIFRKSDGPARSRERVVHLISGPAGTILVAEHNGRLPGLAVISENAASTNPLHVPRRVFEIVTMVVRRSARGQGIGKLLMGASLKWAKQHGAEGVELSVYAFNEDAARMYTAAGFTMLRHRMMLPL
jgi:diamine N-acetyltransferase